MPYYSVCCGAFSSMYPENDICPDCKEHTDFERLDEYDPVCGECEHLGDDVEKAVNFCNHHKFVIKPIIDDFDTCLDECPLKIK